jgi:hypothetical protein
MNLSVNKNTQGQSGVPIPAPIKLKEITPLFKGGYEFPIAKLVSVKFDPKKEVKIKNSDEKEEKPVLIFVWKDAKDRQFTQMEFPIASDDANAEMKVDALQQRLKHIWDVMIGDDIDPDFSGDSFAEFFKNAAEAFNGQKVTRRLKDGETIPEGEEAPTVPRYTTQQVYIKLTYYKTNLQIPMFPNFIQRAGTSQARIPCETLIINPKNDQLQPSEKANKGNGNQNFNNSLDNEFIGEDLGDDFPEV